MQYFPSTPDAQNFFTVARADQVRQSRPLWVQVDGNPVVLTRLENELLAFSALCPHSLGDLSHGTIHNGEIVCPEHGWRFDLRSCASVEPEAGKYQLKKFEVKEEVGLVKVKIKD